MNVSLTSLVAKSRSVYDVTQRHSRDTVFDAPCSEFHVLNHANSHGGHRTQVKSALNDISQTNNVKDKDGN